MSYADSLFFYLHLRLGTWLFCNMQAKFTVLKDITDIII